MIIKSNFTDYYDYVKKTGVDQTIIYERFTKQICKSYYGKWQRKNRWRRARNWVDTNPLTVIQFCDKLYYSVRTPQGFFYEQKLYEPLLNHELEGTQSIWEKPPSAKFKSSCPVIAMFTEEKVEGCFTFDRLQVVENPKLIDFNFGKVLLPEAAYQELMMWFANKKEPPKIPSVDDKTLAEAKGYDKWSFRKPPGVS